MKRWLVSATLGTLLVGGGVLAFAWRHSAASANPRHETRGNSTDRIEYLEQRIAELEARASAERVVVVQQPTWPPDQREVSESEKQPSDPAAEAQIAAQKAAAAAGLEARMQKENPDPAYGREATRLAREGVEVGGGSRVASVECVTSMCKVVTTHDTLEEQSKLATKVETSPFFGAGTYFSYERDVTPPRTTLYVIRAGHKFRE